MVKLTVIIMAVEDSVLEVKKQREKIKDFDGESSEYVKGETHKEVAVEKDRFEEVQTKDVGELEDDMD